MCAIRGAITVKKFAMAMVVAATYCAMSGRAGAVNINDLLAPVEGESAPAAEGGPVPAAPPAPAATPAPPAAAAAPPPPPASGRVPKDVLRDVARNGTVFVLSFGDDGAATGSGALIAADLVLTNSHVVEGSDKKYVVGLAGHGYRAAVKISDTFVARNHRSDFALLRLEKPIGGKILVLGAPVQDLDDVYAAGYPATVDKMGQRLDDFLNGDILSVPDVVISTGAVQNVMDGKAGVEIVTHSARINHGNSGGPLLNGCGQIVGLNTWGSLEDVQVYDADGAVSGKKGRGLTVPTDGGFAFAQSTFEIARFLKARHLVVPTGPDCPG